jgi:hypothetical protein
MARLLKRVIQKEKNKRIPNAATNFDASDEPKMTRRLVLIVQSQGEYFKQKNKSQR